MTDPLAVYGAVAATVLGLLRVFQFWTTERRAVRVMAFVEQFWGARFQNEIVPVKKQDWSGIRMHVVNEGRPIAVDSVGFLNRKTGEAYVIYGPESLPVHLERNHTRDVLGNPGEEWRTALRNGATFVPYAEDREGHIYRGRFDKHFHERAKKLAIQFDNDAMQLRESEQETSTR